MRSILLIILSLLVIGGCSSKQVQAPVKASPDAAASETKTVKAAPSKVDMAPAKAPDGKELYGRVCITCHGKTGDGMGLGQQLFAFDAEEAKWKNGPTEAGILTTLADGIHETSMKPFGEFSEAERKALAGWVLGLRKELLAAEPKAGD